VKRESRRVPYVRKLPRTIAEPKARVEYLLPASRNPEDIHRKDVPTGDTEDRVNKMSLKKEYALKRTWTQEQLKGMEPEEAGFMGTWSAELMRTMTKGIDDDLVGRRAQTHREMSKRNETQKGRSEVRLATHRVKVSAETITRAMKDGKLHGVTKRLPEPDETQTLRMASMSATQGFEFFLTEVDTMYPLLEQHAGALYNHVVNQAQDSQAYKRGSLETMMSRPADVAIASSNHASFEMRGQAKQNQEEHHAANRRRSDTYMMLECMYNDMEEKDPETVQLFGHLRTMVGSEGRLDQMLLFRVIRTVKLRQPCIEPCSEYPKGVPGVITKSMQDLIDLLLAELGVDLHVYEAWCKANLLIVGNRIVLEIEQAENRNKALADRKQKKAEADARKKVQMELLEKAGFFITQNMAPEDIPSYEALMMAKSIMEECDDSEDKNSGDGLVSIEEIIEGCKAMATGGGKHKYLVVWLTKNNLKNFRQFDEDESGEIDFHELTMAAQAFLSESSTTKPTPAPPDARGTRRVSQINKGGPRTRPGLRAAGSAQVTNVTF